MGIRSLNSRWMVGVDVVIGSRFFGVVGTTYFRGGEVCPCADYAMCLLMNKWKLSDDVAIFMFLCICKILVLGGIL